MQEELSHYSEISYFLNNGPFLNLGQDYYDPTEVTIDTIRKMRNEDAQVAAGLQVRALAALSKGWEIHYTGEDKEHGKEMVDLLSRCYDNMGYNSIGNASSLQQSLQEIIVDRLSFGPVVIEPVFEFDRKAGKVAMKRLKVVQPETVDGGLQYDNFGNLTGVVQFTPQGERKLKLDKLIIWTGKSTLISIYKNWLIKDYVLKFWNIALERYGTPLLVGKVRNKKDLTKMRDALDSVRSASNMSIMEQDDVKAILSSADNSHFEEAVRYHDSQIMQGIMVPTLLMSQENVGARALGDTHQDVFLWGTHALQLELSQIMGIVNRKIIDLNFGPQEIYPIFTFPELNIKDKIVLTNMLDKLINLQIVAPDETWIRKELGFPEASTTHRPRPTVVDEVPVDGPVDYSIQGAML